MRPTEAQIIAKGDGVFSGVARYGRWMAVKALQGAVLWEVSEGPAAPRTFFNTWAEAADFVEATPTRLASREWEVTRV